MLKQIGRNPARARTTRRVRTMRNLRQALVLAAIGVVMVMCFVIIVHVFSNASDRADVRALIDAGWCENYQELNDIQILGYDNQDAVCEAYAECDLTASECKR